MAQLRRDLEASSSARRQKNYQAGDRVITNNCRLGTVVRVDRDELGDFVVVSLDILPGEFAYDPWDLEKAE